MRPTRFVCISLLVGVAAVASEPAFTVFGWGANDRGQINVPATLRQVVSLSAGSGHVVAVTADGAVSAWGRNDMGQTVVPATLASPEPFAPGRPTYLVAAGARHTFAVRNGTAVSWGAVTAVPLSDGVAFQAIAAGGDFNLGLRFTGRVDAAGGNVFGQTVVPAAAQAEVVAIAAGDAHALALRRDGTVVGWGRNDFGQADIPARANRIVAIAAAANFSAAVRSDGMVIVWGEGSDGALTPPPGLLGATAVRAGRDCLIAQTDFGLSAWGGAGTPASLPQAELVAADFACGDGFAVAVRAPIVTRAPGVVQIEEGMNAELSAEFSDLTGATLQWSPMPPRSSGGRALKIPEASTGQFGPYTLTATYPGGYTLKTAGFLVVGVRPRITQQIAPTVIGYGNGSVQLTLVVVGSEPMNFQWRKDGVVLPDQTDRTLLLSPLTDASAGRYSCLASNAWGMVESTETQVTVMPIARQSTMAEAGERVVLRIRPNTAIKPFRDFVWSKNGAVIPGATDEALVIARFSAQDAGQYSVTYSDGANQSGHRDFFFLTMYVTRPTSGGWLVPSVARVAPGRSVTVRLAGVGDGGGLNYRWESSTAPAAEGVNLLSATVGPLADFRDSLLTVRSAHPETRWAVLRANIYSSSAPNLPGAVLSQSGPEELFVGERGEFTVEFQPPVRRISWRKDGVEIAGQTQARLIIASARDEDAGTYVASAETDRGVFEPSWKLAIVGPPRILEQPKDAFIGTDGTARLAAVVDSRRRPKDAGIQAYRWYRDGEEFLSPLPDTGETLITRVPGRYRLKIFHDSGVIDSDVAVVNPAPRFLPQTRSAFYFYGGDVELGAAVVRGDGTVIMAAKRGGLMWMGEAKLDGRGAFELPGAWRTTGGVTPLAREPAFSCRGLVRETDLLGSFAPGSQQNFSMTAVVDRSFARSGFFRGDLAGRGDGEVWMFVAPDERIALFLRDGYLFGSGSAQPRGPGGDYRVFLSELNADPELSTLVFDATNEKATVTLVAREADIPRVVGRYVLERQGTRGESRFSNLSVRAEAGAGDDTLITGFALAGTVTRPLLVRAVGPGLVRFGVAGVLENPGLAVFREGNVVGENEDWGANRAALGAAFGRVGAFVLPEGSLDAAILAPFAPGAYTAQIKAPPGARPGTALAEVYEDGTSTESRLSNLSVRARLRGDEPVVVGFVVSGTAPKRVLVRAIGPALGVFGLAGAARDPRLRLMRGDALIAANDDWAEDQDAAGGSAGAARAAGAFPLSTSSRDAAVVRLLEPGAYAAIVESKGGAGGVVLAEVYEVP